MRRLLFLLLLLFPFAANASCPATLSDCGNINVNNGNFNEIVVGPAAGGPQGPGTINTHGGIFQDGVPFGGGGGGPTFTNGIIIPNSIYYAKNFGSCTWDATHDVGPCIQLAINAAGANVGGGTVVVPNGTYGLATPLTITTQNTSLTGTGYGMATRTNVVPNTPNGPTILTWIGSPATAPASQIYILTIAPTLANQKLLIGTNVQGIIFKCNGIAGCSGELIASVRYAKQEIGVYEPAGIAYTGSVVTSGSQAIQVSNSAGLIVGQAVVGANIPDGLYVASIVDGTHVNISGKASGTATETVTFGGEGARLDVVDQLHDSNDTQFIDMVFDGRNLSGAGNATPPLLMIGGSGVVGGFGSHFGNSSLNNFTRVTCVTTNGLCTAINNTDHNYFGFVSNQNIGGSAASFVSNGSLDPNNGGARDNRFNYVGTHMVFTGTDTAGFTSASVNNDLLYVDTANGGSVPTVGTGASVCVSTANQHAIGCYGGLTSVLAQYPDGTIMGGNNRGTNALDLQIIRLDPTEVASGQTSAVLGGESNQATAHTAATVGGKENLASGIASFAYGIQARSALLYAVSCHSTGTVATGKSAQECTQNLKAVSGANTTTIRLTADLNAAGSTNCVNIQFAGAVFNMDIHLSATDETNAVNSFVWTQPMDMMTRIGLAGTTTLTVGPTPVFTGLGTGTGVGAPTVSETADTTNACYNLSWTPPTGNTDIWDVNASVHWTETD